MKPRKYKESTILKLKKLRKSGHTIGEIMDLLKMPKTTVWHHVQGIELEREARIRIRSRRGGSRERRIERERQAREKAEKLLVSDKREKVIALTMLYWAEGSKGSMSFINTDSRMMRTFLHLMCQVFKVTSNQFWFVLRLYGNADVEKSLDFWSRELSVERDDFKIRINDGQKNSKSKYGMCRVTMKKGGYMLKILTALIDLISEKPL